MILTSEGSETLHRELLGPKVDGPARPMRVRDLLRLLEADGWRIVAQRGSHRQYKHEIKPGRVTVAGRPAEHLAPGTLASILKQAGLKVGRDR